MMRMFDLYSLKARIFPAIIAAAPAFAAAALLVSWDNFELSQVVVSGCVMVLTYAIGDAARARGRAIEGKLHADRGGLPSITMLRRADETINGGSKDRYRHFLGVKLGIAAPTIEQENSDQIAADSFYAQCGNWLRENTRDSQKFHILLSENITYGFRRNLLGVKALSLCLNILVVALCLFLLWLGGWDLTGTFGSRVLAVLLVAGAHAIYMVAAVNRDAVWDASRVYARQLILSCETFLSAAQEPQKNSPGGA